MYKLTLYQEGWGWGENDPQPQVKDFLSNSKLSLVTTRTRTTRPPIKSTRKECTKVLKFGT